MTFVCDFRMNDFRMCAILVLSAVLSDFGMSDRYPAIWVSDTRTCVQDSWVWLYVLLVVVIPTSLGFVMGLVKTGLSAPSKVACLPTCPATLRIIVQP